VKRLSYALYPRAESPVKLLEQAAAISAMLVIPVILLFRFTGIFSLFILTAPLFVAKIAASDAFHRFAEKSGVEKELPFFLVYASELSAAGISLFSALLSLAGSPLKFMEVEGRKIAKRSSAGRIDPITAMEEYSKNSPSPSFANFLSSYSFKAMAGAGSEDFLSSSSSFAIKNLEEAWNSYVGRAEGIGEISLALFSLFPLVWITMLSVSPQFSEWYPLLLFSSLASFVALILISYGRLPPHYPPPVPPLTYYLSAAAVGLVFCGYRWEATLATITAVLTVNGMRFALDMRKDLSILGALSSFLAFIEGQSMIGKGAAEALAGSTAHFSKSPIGGFVLINSKRAQLGLDLQWFKWGFSSILSWLTIRSIEEGELDPISLSSLSRFSSSLVQVLKKSSGQLYLLAFLSFASPFLMALSVNVAGGFVSFRPSDVFSLILMSTMMGAWLMGKLAGLSLRFTLPLGLVIPLAFTAMRIF